jgi:hypothetical protein
MTTSARRAKPMQPPPVSPEAGVARQLLVGEAETRATPWPPAGGCPGWRCEKACEFEACRQG